MWNTTVTSIDQGERGEILIFTPNNLSNTNDAATSTPLISVPVHIVTGDPTNSDQALTQAIQQAVGPNDPNLSNTEQPADVSEVLSGTDWMSLLNPQTSQPTPAVTPSIIQPESSTTQQPGWGGGPNDPMTDRMMSLLNPQASSPTPVNDSQPGVINQILSGTYAKSVLQTQLSSQGLTPGYFVNPFPPK